MFVGHMGGSELGAVALGNMWCNVTGYSIQYGGLTALDTLASQAFGAKNMRLVGVNAQRALAIVGLLCIPITALWWFATGPVFELMDIEAETTELAKRCKSSQVQQLPLFLFLGSVQVQQLP